MPEDAVVSLPLQKEDARGADGLARLKLQMSELLAGLYNHSPSTFTTYADGPLAGPADRADQSSSLPLQIEEG